MKTTRTHVDGIWINDYVVTKAGTFDVIDITYSHTTQRKVLFGRNIVTGIVKEFSATFYSVLDKRYEPSTD